MVIGERAIAFAEQYVRRHSDSIEQLLCDDGSGSIAAVNDTGYGSRNLPDALADALKRHFGDNWGLCSLCIACDACVACVTCLT